MENITYTAVRNPKWLNQAHTFLECEVNFDHITDEEWSAFSCIPAGYDAHEHTGKIFTECVNGDYGVITEFELPAIDVTEQVRAVRDEILVNEVDPIVTNPLRWDAMTPEKQQEWADYRQALLDLPVISTATLEWNDAELGYEWVNLVLPTKPE